MTSLVSLISPIAKRLQIVALVVLILLSASACGRKPGALDAPEGSTTYTYPPVAP